MPDFLELVWSRAFFRLGRWKFAGLRFLLFVLLDVNPVSLQLDLDRRFQLRDITVDFKVRFLGMARARSRDSGQCGLTHGRQSSCLPGLG